MSIDEQTLRALRKSYRSNLGKRLELLEDASGRLPDPEAATEIRAIAHKLRGSGASYGYPEITERAAAVEDASETAIAADLSVLIDLVRRTASSDEP